MEFALALGIAGFIVSLVWLRIGWRAMQAHERLAGALEDVARDLKSRPRDPG